MDCEERRRLLVELAEPNELMGVLLRKQIEAACTDDVGALFDFENRLHYAAELRQRVLDRLKRHISAHACHVVP